MSETTGDTARVQARITGKVQGVGYRYYAVHLAQRLGVVGTVRNSPDGGVEVVAEGARPALETFIGDLRHGPAAAEVGELTEAWAAPTGDFTDFRILA